VAVFGAFITSTSEGTDLPDYVKRMVLWTRMRLDVRAILLKKEGDLSTIEMCLEVAIERETAIRLEAEYAEAYGRALGERPNKSKEKVKGKEKAWKDTSKGHSLQGTSQDSHSGFCSRGRRRGRGGYGQGGQQHSSNGSGPQSAGTPQRPGACKSCSKLGYWAQDCRTNLLEGSAASMSNRSHQEKRRPSEAFLSSTGPHLVK
jgi:hypothetical protein